MKTVKVPKKVQALNRIELLLYCEAFNKMYRHMVANGEAPIYPEPMRQLQEAVDEAKRRGLI